MQMAVRTIPAPVRGCNKAYLTLVPFVAVVQQHTKTGGDTFCSRQTKSNLLAKNLQIEI